MSASIPRLRRNIVYALALGALLLALYLTERYVTGWLSKFIPSELAADAYLALFAVLALILALALARLVLNLGGIAVSAVSEKPSLRPLTPYLRAMVNGLAILAFFAIGLQLLSLEMVPIAGVAGWISSALAEFTSLLVALIVALQLREIVGNYIAWAIIRLSELVEVGDYICFEKEVMRVAEIGYSHTLLVSNLGERVYVPNIRFLLEAFRKAFGRSNWRYVEVRFALPYTYPYEAVESKVAEVVRQYRSQPGNAGVSDYKLLVVELSSFSVVYELRLKPIRAVFPFLFRGEIMKLLLKEFGEALTTPAIVRVPSIEVREAGQSGQGGE